MTVYKFIKKDYMLKKNNLFPVILDILIIHLLFYVCCICRWFLLEIILFQELEAVFVCAYEEYYRH